MTELLRHSGVNTPTLREIETCDAIFVLGEDLTQTAARMALAVRQAVKGKARQKATELKVDVWQIAAIQNIGQNDRFPLYLTSLDSTRLDDVACVHYHAAYVDQARLGFAVAHLLDSKAPAVPDADDTLMLVARQIADGLSKAKHPLIISGTTCETPALLDAAANIVSALRQKNRIGTKALNFSYTLASGAQGSLYQQQADYILLFINNPGCHACTETIDALKNAPIINRLLGQKKLTVLSIYPDEELDEWRKHLNEFPKEWINGYDKKFAIKEQQLYDLKAIPTLYLLNKEKTVLLKDATAQAIEEYLTNVELE
jgi:hypothetical protein